jgi:hypothetical protein
VPADRHGWNELSNYLLIHERQVQAFADEGFVLSDGLHAVITRDRQKRPAAVAIKGRLTCAHDLFLDIEMHLDIMERDSRAWVRLGACKYHAGIAGEAHRTIFRYDTSHPYTDHEDNYHKHLFDHSTWREVGTPIWIGRRDWPHLSEVLEELQVWWRDTGRHLSR